MKVELKCLILFSRKIRKILQNVIYRNVSLRAKYWFKFACKLIITWLLSNIFWFLIEQQNHSYLGIIGGNHLYIVFSPSESGMVHSLPWLVHSLSRLVHSKSWLKPSFCLQKTGIILHMDWCLISIISYVNYIIIGTKILFSRSLSSAVPISYFMWTRSGKRTLYSPNIGTP